VTVCVPDWLALSIVILLGGAGGTEAILRLVELRRGRDGRPPRNRRRRE